MAETIQWLLANGESIAATMLAVMALASAIVNLTETPDDDAILGKVYPYVEYLAGIFTSKAKQLPGEAALLAAEAEATDVVAD